MAPKSDPNTFDIHLLGRDYQVTCTPEERPALESAAHYLDDAMAKIKDSGRVLGIERIAIMAALNISNDLLLERSAHGVDNAVAQDEINRLTGRIDFALSEEHPQLPG